MENAILLCKHAIRCPHGNTFNVTNYITAIVCNQCGWWPAQPTKHSGDGHMCMCGPDLPEHVHELEGTFYVCTLDLPSPHKRRHLNPLPHDVPKVQVRCQHADLQPADTCGVNVSGRCMIHTTYTVIHQCERIGRSYSLKLYMIYKQVHSYACGTFLGGQVGVVAVPMRI